ncbi:MAG: hypothetical protein GY820_24275 [Gammaproteobacteria bacterium]|nr:hypothetical protein [Gammaproteobacteria bacterium]
MKAYRGDYSYSHLYATSSRLKTIAHDLHTLGYGLQDITKIKNKQVEELVKFWKEKSLSVGTIKNRRADMRFVGER